MYCNQIHGIDIVVKSTKNNGTSQVLVEFWAKKISNFEIMDIILKTDTTKLMPTKIEDNTELSDFDKIQYEGDPTDEKRQISKEVLSNTFEFGQEGLAINTFEYRGQDLIQLTLRATDYSNLISATENKVLLGKMSFKLDGEIEQNEFSVSRISLICNDNEDGFSRNSIDGEICSELARIEYLLKGSISGQVEANTYSSRTLSKNIATIKVFTKESVKDINWEATGNAYKEIRDNLPEPVAEYTTTAEDNGSFKVEELEYGEYVILVDKNNYTDCIITDIQVNSNEDTNLTEKIGKIVVHLGDVNKDGRVAIQDKTLFDPMFKDRLSEADINDDNKAGIQDKTTFDDAFKHRNESKKTVISLLETK